MSDTFFEFSSVISLSQSVAFAASSQSGVLILVTGGNRGIGLKIVHRLSEVLASSTSSTIFLTSRSESKAEQAVKSLKSDLINAGIGIGLRIIPQALDIEDEISVNKMKEMIEQEYDNRLDILINNAGIAFSMSDTTPFAEQARYTVNVNYYGTKRMMLTFLPSLRNSVLSDGGRVVNVSSSSGVLTGSSVSTEIQQRLLSAQAGVSDIDAVMEEFVAAAEGGTHKEQGFWGSAYAASKSGVTQLTRVLAREEAEALTQLETQTQTETETETESETQKETQSETQKETQTGAETPSHAPSESHAHVRLFACCPGLCRTGMTGRGGWTSAWSVAFWLATWVIGHSAYAGADTPAWLAVGDVPGGDGEEGGSGSYDGKFVRGRVVKDY
jgi:NAD(P)-dependent dehydrogenase (short-subunit alcohol dehydrogenase family)